MRRITLFAHCGQCYREKPRNISAQDWARLEVGWTPEGLQVWCLRHDRNVLDLHFDGQKVRKLGDHYGDPAP